MENVNEVEEALAKVCERGRLRQTTNAEKEEELRGMGFEPLEHPVSTECRVCGFNRRYSSHPSNCLYCEAFN